MRAADQGWRWASRVAVWSRSAVFGLSLAATVARAAVYFVLPSLAPANDALWLLLLLVLLRAALTCLTEGWRLPAEPAAAAAAPWALPAPKVKTPPPLFFFALVCLAPACYLACCGRLLADPLLPPRQVYLWLFAAVDLALFASVVVVVQNLDEFAPCNPEGLMDAYTPLGSLLSCARLPAQARVLRATTLRLPAEFRHGGSALHHAHYATLAALDGAAAAGGSADAQQLAAATPTLDLFEALLAYLLQGAPPQQQVHNARQPLFVLLQLLGLQLSLGLALGLQALAAAPWLQQLVALQERDASAALAAAQQWLAAPLLTPLSVLSAAFWLAGTTLLLQRFRQADHLLSQACVWAAALALHLPLHLLAAAAQDAASLLLCSLRLCCSSGGGDARERVVCAALLQRAAQRTAQRALTLLYLRAAARAPATTLLLLAVLDLVLQVTVVALLGCNGGALAGRAVPPAQGGPGRPRTLGALRAALSGAAARGLLSEDCAVCATALGEATPSRLPPRAPEYALWAPYEPPDALQPWARHPAAVCLLSCGHVYHALCLAACEVTQTRAGGSPRCPSCRCRSYSSALLEARPAAPAAAAAAPAAPAAAAPAAAAALGGGAGARQRRGSVTRRCGHCRGEGHDRRACPSL